MNDNIAMPELIIGDPIIKDIFQTDDFLATPDHPNLINISVFPISLYGILCIVRKNQSVIV